MKRTSIIGFSEAGLKRFGAKAARFAAIEGLGAHANSVKVRLAGQTTSKKTVPAKKAGLVKKTKK